MPYHSCVFSLVRTCILAVFMFSCGPLFAQALPGAQVWLAKIDHGQPTVPVEISARDGYNNQPLFSTDGRFIYYTAEQADGQTDIVRYEIASGQRRIVTRSPESEYSPTPIPGQHALSVVRVEEEQRQRLWRIDLESGAFTLLLPSVEPVGYHTWFSEDSVALFVLGESFTLHRAIIGSQPSQLAFDNIGRTLRKHPQTGQVLFVDKNPEPWSISAIDMEDGVVHKIMSLFPGIEDFEVDHAGRFWMGSGSKLYRSDPGNKRWILTTDLSEYGIDNITRLAGSPNGSMLAIVGGR